MRPETGTNYSRQAILDAAKRAFFAETREGRCCWCGGPLKGRQQSWCSKECRELGWAHFNWGPFARLVMARDHDCCQWRDCGVTDFFAYGSLLRNLLVTRCPYDIADGCQYNEAPSREYRWATGAWCNCGREVAWLKYACPHGFAEVLQSEQRDTAVASHDFVLAVHHILPLKDGGAVFDPLNTVTLCRYHHGLAHRAYNRKQAEDFCPPRPLELKPARNERREA